MFESFPVSVKGAASMSYLNVILTRLSDKRLESTSGDGKKRWNEGRRGEKEQSLRRRKDEQELVKEKKGKFEEKVKEKTINESLNL